MKRHEEAAQQARRRIEALDIVWFDLFGPVDAAREQAPGGPPVQGAGDGQDPFAGVVPEDLTPAARMTREVAPAIDGTFSIREVLQAMQQRHPELTDALLDRMRPTISGTLRRMCDEGHLTLVLKGSGRRPSTYTARRDPPPAST